MFEFESSKKLAKLFAWTDYSGELNSSFWGAGEELHIVPDIGGVWDIDLIAFCGQGRFVNIRIPISENYSSYNERFEAFCYSVYDELFNGTQIKNIFEVFGYNSVMCLSFEINVELLCEENKSAIEKALGAMVKAVRLMRDRLREYDYYV